MPDPVAFRSGFRTDRAVHVRAEELVGSPVDLVVEAIIVGERQPASPSRFGIIGRARRLRKFARRHRVGVAASALVVLSLLLGLGGTAWQARVATTERDRARLAADKTERVVEVLVDLFRTTNPEIVPGGDTLRIGDFLERAEAKVLKDLEDQPAVQASVKRVLGNMYHVRGQLEKAETLLKDALAQQQDLVGPDDPDAIGIMHDLANLLVRRGEREQAIALLRESLARYRRIYGTEHKDVAQAMQALAAALPSTSSEIRPLLDSALVIRRRLQPPDPVKIASNLNDLGIYHWRREEFGETQRLFEESLGIVRADRGEDHPHTLAVMTNLAVVYSRLGENERAASMIRELLDKKRRVLGPEAPEVGTTLQNLGTILTRSGDYTGAEDAHREALAIRRKILGEDHAMTAHVMGELAYALQYQNRYEEALALVQDAHARTRRREGPDAVRTANLTRQLSMLLLDLERPEEALRHAREAVRIFEQSYPGRDHSYLFYAYWALAYVLEASDAYEEAESYSRQALAFFEEQGTAIPSIAGVRCMLGRLLAAQGRYVEAEPMLRQGYAALFTVPSARPKDLAATRRRLAETYTALGQPEQAATYRTVQPNR